jgi:DNA polymerase zeta
VLRLCITCASTDAVTANASIQQLAASIDHALALSFRKNPSNTPVERYVAHISLVKGVPFYGYHVGYQYFLKVYLRNPGYMTRLADLLVQGAVLARVIQPYESHLQYLLQWMCDYNLYGCGFISCRRVRFRSPLPEAELRNTESWNERSADPSWLLNPNDFPRQSHCELEIDVCVQDITNRHEIGERNIHHDFRERFLKSSSDEKFMHSMAGLWSDEATRRRNLMGISDQGTSPFPPEALVTMSADPEPSKGNWVHEEEYFQLMENIIEAEKSEISESLDFDTFLTPRPEESSINTALQSVEDLYPAQNATDSGNSGIHQSLSNSLSDNSNVIMDTDVVERIASNQAQSWPEDGKAPNPFVEGGEAMKAHYDDDEFGYDDNEFDDLRQDQIEADMKPKIMASQSTASTGKSSSQGTPIAKSNSSQLSKSDGQKSIASSFRITKSSSQTEAQSKKSAVQPPEMGPSESLPGPMQWRVSMGQSLGLFSNRGSAIKYMSEPPAVGPAPPSAIQPRQLSSLLPEVFDTVLPNLSVYYTAPPPSEGILESLIKDGRPSEIAQDAFYSDELDVPNQPRDYAGRVLKLESSTVPFLPDFDRFGASKASFGNKEPATYNRSKVAEAAKNHACTHLNWQFITPPPTYEEVESWVENHRVETPRDANRWKRGPRRKLSQLEGPTQTILEAAGRTRRKTTVQHQTQYMGIMSLEVHVNTRRDFAPDPAEDCINCVFWSFRADEELGELENGVVCLATENVEVGNFGRSFGVDIEYETDELDLLNRIIDIVRELDPDILVGYEVHNGSWGYLIERARLKFEFDLASELSRVKSEPQKRFRFGKDADRWGFQKTSTIRVVGRHMINIWRAMRGEVNLLQYTMENVVFQVLKKRIPHYSFAQLSTWYRSGSIRQITKVLNYFLSRVQLNLLILESVDLVARTSEQARLLGVDFFSVISRGSQFKVESLMFRIAKPENYILVSPSRKQVGEQNALECLPLVMEPQSNFYPSPLLVLDFQSLYPSVMIAYNYCYSTCLGRVISWRGRNKMGFRDLQRPPGVLELLKNNVNISPNGMMYVRPEIRKSLLAKMLTEILETRIMVKSGMKRDKDDVILQKLLNNRQLALKLIANVTYGYASASFSGRMPCSEIADSIVQTARETLERAVALIHSVDKWKAEVVYGDTDSLFVYLKGRTRDEAFQIGKEIADAVTAANPRPVTLKFEKVYHPCVLLAKKRYVGFKYEQPEQRVPEFDAKGIETVRRDGTPAEQKIEERALKILFRTHDLSKVKRYFQRQCGRIMAGQVSVQDFQFAREVRLGTYSDNGVPTAGALIATRRMLKDARREPQYGERVPYVVIAGAPGARLIDRCVDPEVLLGGGGAELDAEYYIRKNIIPPLERIFGLVGANVRGWYEEIPKVQRLRAAKGGEQQGGGGGGGGGAGKRTLENFLRDNICVVCRDKLPAPPPFAAGAEDEARARPVCDACVADAPGTLLGMTARLRRLEGTLAMAERVCRGCAGIGFGEEVACDSRDCPVFYTRVKQRGAMEALKGDLALVAGVLED